MENPRGYIPSAEDEKLLEMVAGWEREAEEQREELAKWEREVKERREYFQKRVAELSEAHNKTTPPSVWREEASQEVERLREAISEDSGGSYLQEELITMVDAIVQTRWIEKGTWDESWEGTTTSALWREEARQELVRLRKAISDNSCGSYLPEELCTMAYAIARKSWVEKGLWDDQWGVLVSPRTFLQSDQLLTALLAEEFGNDRIFCCGDGKYTLRAESPLFGKRSADQANDEANDEAIDQAIADNAAFPEFPGPVLFGINPQWTMGQGSGST